jgi:hypothetical protein
MSRRPNGDLTACLVLTAILAGCAYFVSAVTATIGIVVAALLGAEIDRSGRLIASRLVGLASLLLPEVYRRDHADEWVDQVLCAGKAGIRPVLTALGIALLAAPRIGMRLRTAGAAMKFLRAWLLAYTEFYGIELGTLPQPKRRLALLLAAGCHFLVEPAFVIQALIIRMRGPEARRYRVELCPSRERRSGC